MALYPRNWPRCPSCERPALDGHITCGDVRCDESGQRDKRAAEYRASLRDRDYSEGFEAEAY